MKRIVTLACVGITAVALAGLPAANAGIAARSAPIEGLDGPRGFDIGRTGKTVVAEADGTISRAFRFGPNAGTTKKIGKVPAGFLAPAVAVSPDNTVWALTTAGDPGTAGAASLFMWKPGGKRQKVADIAAFVANHPDPFDLEDNPEDSNPYDVSATRGKSVLVADAAANAVMRVTRSGKIHVIARVKPRIVEMPAGYDNPEFPPPGTMMPAEGVATAVAMGPDGAVYVGELRGFPATPETSRVWRVKPGAAHAICRPARPDEGNCREYVDGLTSVVGLDVAPGGAVYAAELSKQSWLAFEEEHPGSEEGAVIRISVDKVLRELSPGEVILPGSVAVAPNRKAWVSGPIFGPGSVFKVS